MNNVLEQPNPELRNARASSWLPIRLGKQEQAEPRHGFEAIKDKTGRERETERKREGISSLPVRNTAQRVWLEAHTPQCLISLFVQNSKLCYQAQHLAAAAAAQPVATAGCCFLTASATARGTVST